jgi:hypothetical protein
VPGTSLPAPGRLPLAYIHQPAPSPTQSAPGRNEWLLEFEPSSPPQINPLMGWIGSRDLFADIRLRFPDQQSAIEFAEKQGWPYVVQNPPLGASGPGATPTTSNTNCKTPSPVPSDRGTASYRSAAAETRRMLRLARWRHAPRALQPRPAPQLITEPWPAIERRDVAP